MIPRSSKSESVSRLLTSLSGKSKEKPPLPLLSNPGIQLATNRLVTGCRNCKMVNVSDRKRIICPYCGTFYDPNEERLVVRPKLVRKI